MATLSEVVTQVKTNKQKTFRKKNLKIYCFEFTGEVAENLCKRPVGDAREFRIFFV